MRICNHTPSPWHARQSPTQPDAWEIVADACESPLAEVSHWPDEEGEASEEALANLNAMTAAPMLMAACRMVIERWEGGDLAEAARFCQGALDEATGGSRVEESAFIDIYAVLSGRRQIAAIWSIEDVRESRPDLSDDQAWQVLQAVDRHHDCNHGITWETLDSAAGDLFPALETA